MTTYPNCKINLGLQVIRRRPDGYHDLETIFVPVHELHDELEITESHGVTEMVQEGIVLDNDPAENLCVKAWRLLHEEFGIPTVKIRLNKMIPFGAGLGGGSADASFTLKMLNEMYSLGLDTAALEQRATHIGADCAFFIRNSAAYATGIGDKLETIDLDLDSYTIKIEIPEGEHISTREAYAGINIGTTVRPDLREAIRKPIKEWRNMIVNDFEASIFPNHPTIASLKEEMYSRGAIYASMTGSGAAVYGIFPK